MKQVAGGNRMEFKLKPGLWSADAGQARCIGRMMTSRLQRTPSWVLWSQMPLDTEVEAAEGHSGSIRPRPTLASPVESLSIPGAGGRGRGAKKTSTGKCLWA